MVNINIVVGVLATFVACMAFGVAMIVGLGVILTIVPVGIGTVIFEWGIMISFTIGIIWGSLLLVDEISKHI